MKIICVVSAPFKFMKIAPLMEAFKARTIVRPYSFIPVNITTTI